MKRFFFTAIAIAAVAVSCTKSGLLETPKTYQDPITFEPYSGKATLTKATVADDATIRDGFRVIGFEETSGNITVSDTYLRKVVKGELSQGTDPTTTWDYVGDMYWPETNKMTFVAYGLNMYDDVLVGEDGDISAASSLFTMGTTDDGKNDYTNFTYTVPSTVADQVDLLISPALKGCISEDACGEFDGATKAKVVNLKFYHVLSRIGFKIETSNITVTGTSATTSKVTVKDVKLYGAFIPSAQYDLTKAVTIEEVTNEETNEKETKVVYSTEDDGNPVSVSTIYSLFDTNKEGFDNTKHPAFVTDGTKGTKTFDIYANASYDATTAYAEPTADEDASSDNRYMMIIPCTVGDYVSGTTTKAPYIEVTYQITGAAEQTATLPLPKVKVTKDGKEQDSNFIFAPGKAYEFVFTISTDAVGFGVTVDPWDTDLNDNNNLADDDITYPIN